ncbi:MAG: FAD/NAD(P)-binding protein, partial [Bacteroidota bacterium]
MKKTGIIGGGFAGTMTAVHLIEKCTGPFELVVVNEPGTLNKGVAYNPYSQKQLLNVIASKMSAYPEKPDHFVDWISMRAEFAGLEHGLVANAFLPRYLYGEYLTEIWGEALKTAQSKQVQIRMIEDTVVDLEVSNSGILMVLSGGDRIMTDDCILATGNLIPGNPKIKNSSFFESPHYFQNPWEKLAVSNVRNLKSIMLAGNGLTMVDTVIGLLENGFHGTIYSVSPNGYNILPHRHNGLTYSKLREEFPATASLSQIVRLVHKHIKSVRKLGISAEPVIDSIRPLTQQIWRTMTDAEKQLFISRLRHLWGVARHRI